MNTMIETMRTTFADRAVWMGDSDFVPVPERDRCRNVSLAAAARASSIRSRGCRPRTRAIPIPQRRRHRQRYRLALAPLDEEKGIHTTHFSVVDKLEQHGELHHHHRESTWGTGIMVPGYGFLLNTSSPDFNFTPQCDAATGNPGANDVAPFKRPRSSMSPSMLFRIAKPVAALRFAWRFDDHQFGVQHGH